MGSAGAGVRPSSVDSAAIRSRHAAAATVTARGTARRDGTQRLLVAGRRPLALTGGGVSKRALHSRRCCPSSDLLWDKRRRAGSVDHSLSELFPAPRGGANRGARGRASSRAQRNSRPANAGSDPLVRVPPLWIIIPENCQQPRRRRRRYEKSRSSGEGIERSSSGTCRRTAPPC